jgi:hypothetical protein
MQKNAASQSGIFNPRVLLAFTLCSVGALLAMFSLAATPPVETMHANTSVPPDSRNFLSTFASNANHLPRGVSLPPGTQFSLNGQGDPLKQQPTAGFWDLQECRSDREGQVAPTRWAIQGSPTNNPLR